MSARTPVNAYLSLGSNITPEAHLPQALAYLGRTPGILVGAVSPVYRTPPWGNTNQAPFLNACAALKTTLSPIPLLDALQAVETALKRERMVHWGPRTMDIDLMLYGNDVIEEERLVVPHPYLGERAFVLIPLCDIAPEAKHPVSGKRMAELLADLKEEDRAGVERIVLPDWESGRSAQ